MGRLMVRVEESQRGTRDGEIGEGMPFDVAQGLRQDGSEEGLPAKHAKRRENVGWEVVRCPSASSGSALRSDGMGVKRSPPRRGTYFGNGIFTHFSSGLCHQL